MWDPDKLRTADGSDMSASRGVHRPRGENPRAPTTFRHVELVFFQSHEHGALQE